VSEWSELEVVNRCTVGLNKWNLCKK